jgi:hypothetical protein
MSRNISGIYAGTTTPGNCNRQRNSGRLESLNDHILRDIGLHFDPARGWVAQFGPPKRYATDINTQKVGKRRKGITLIAVAALLVAGLSAAAVLHAQKHESAADHSPSRVVAWDALPWHRSTSHSPA